MPIKADFRKLLALLCLLAGWTCYSFAAPAAAVLHPVDTVRVNGTAVSHSTMIFNGDIIRTGLSAARLEASGYAILLDKETTASIQDDQLNIICGSAVVKTLQGMSTRVGNLVLKSSGQSARFEVKRQGESMQISDLDGTLNLSDGSRNVALTKGNQFTLACSPCAEEAGIAQLASVQPSCVLSSVVPTVPAAAGNAPIYAFAGAAVGGPAIVVPLIYHRTPISPDRP